MNWFKDLFIRKDSQAESLPSIPEKKPNISEPVLSFVQTFKANPKRFKLFYIREKEWSPCGFMFEWTVEHPISMKLVDTKENLAWTFYWYVGRSYGLPINSYPVFLSPEEAKYIFDTIHDYHQKRFDEFLKTKDRIKLKRGRKEREALKKVYCK